MLDQSLYGPIQPGQYLASTQQDAIRYNDPVFGELTGTASEFKAYMSQGAIPVANLTYSSPSQSSMSPLLLLGALALGLLLLRGR